MIEAMAGNVLMGAASTSRGAALRGRARPLSEQDAADLRLSRGADQGRAAGRGRRRSSSSSCLRFPDNGPLHQIAARAYAAQNMRLKQHQHQGEYYAWQGNLRSRSTSSSSRSRPATATSTRSRSSSRGCARSRRAGRTEEGRLRPRRADAARHWPAGARPHPTDAPPRRTTRSAFARTHRILAAPLRAAARRARRRRGRRLRRLEVLRAENGAPEYRSRESRARRHRRRSSRRRARCNAVTTVLVGSQISGQIKELLVDFNSAVKQGQLLARIDPETYEIRVRQAEADLEAARTAHVAEAERRRGAALAGRCARRSRTTTRSATSTASSRWSRRASSRAPSSTRRKFTERAPPRRSARPRRRSSPRRRRSRNAAAIDQAARSGAGVRAQRPREDRRSPRRSTAW